jgi:SsrA-binding protein
MKQTSYINKQNSNNVSNKNSNKHTHKNTNLLNKKAYHNYFIGDIIEVGIVLKGSEVKAIRAGKVNIKDAFVKIINNEAFVFGMHISHLDSTHSIFRPDEKRERKLLLHKKQIAKLFESVSKQGNAILVTKLYFNKRNIAKLNIALGEGKKLYDKRNELKKKQQDMDTKRDMKNY